TCTLTGLLTGDNTTDTATCGLDATAAPNVYVDAIIPNPLDPAEAAKYQVVYFDGTLTINQATLSILPPGDITIPYGSPAPILSGSIVGLQNNDNITVTYTSNYQQGDDVGSYPITAVINDPDHKLGNYIVTGPGNPGTITVMAVDLTVTA